jgi:hypothetical protein
MKARLPHPRAPANGPGMKNPVEIENIEGMRCRAGIDDVELRDQIRSLRVGDTVNLTFLKDAASPTGETLPVRITFIRGDCFRGSLAVKPASAQLSKLMSGGPIIFRAAHIHSIPRKQADEEE